MKLALENREVVLIGSYDIDSHESPSYSPPLTVADGFNAILLRGWFLESKSLKRMKLSNFRDVLQSQVWIFNFVLSLTEELGNFTLSSTGLEGTNPRRRLPLLADEGCEDVSLFEELIYRLDLCRICLNFALLSDRVFSFILVFWRIFLVFGQWSWCFEF